MLIFECLDDSLVMPGFCLPCISPVSSGNHSLVIHSHFVKLIACGCLFEQKLMRESVRTYPTLTTIYTKDIITYEKSCIATQTLGYNFHSFRALERISSPCPGHERH